MLYNVTAVSIAIIMFSLPFLSHDFNAARHLPTNMTEPDTQSHTMLCMGDQDASALLRACPRMCPQAHGFASREPLNNKRSNANVWHLVAICVNASSRQPYEQSPHDGRW